MSHLEKSAKNASHRLHHPRRDQPMLALPVCPAEKPSRSGTGFATIADQQNVQIGRNT